MTFNTQNQTIGMIANAVTANKDDALIEHAKSNAEKLVHSKAGTFVLLSTKVSGIAGVYKIKEIKMHDLDGQDLSNIEAVNGPTVRVIPTESVSFANRARDSIKSTMRSHGFNLGGGLNLIPTEKVKVVYKELVAIGDKFYEEVDAFKSEYPNILEEQKLMFPDICKLIDLLAPDIEKLKRSFKFSISSPIALSIDNDAAKELSGIVDLDNNSPLDTVLDELIKSISKEAYHFWRYSLQSGVKATQNSEYQSRFIDPNDGRTGLRSSCVATLKNLRDKIDGLAQVEPRFTRIVDVLDTAASFLPDGYKTNNGLIKDLNVVKVLINTFDALRNEEYIHHLINSSDDVSKIEAEASSELSSRPTTSNNSSMFINNEQDENTSTEQDDVDVIAKPESSPIDFAGVDSIETYEKDEAEPEPETETSFGDDLFADF